ncbi:type I restriction enzyme, S subunit [Candidatus Kryptobacter tengchongensis]|nr:type I restriction enzyme, S subunit [Candidatus Kryptobacter tengchongensis]
MKEFKDKEKLPEGWKRVKLGEVIKYEQPWKYTVKNEKYDPKHGVPVLTAGKTFILGYTDETTGVYENVPAIIFDDFTTESRFVNFPFKVKSSALKILKSANNDTNLFFVFNLLQTVPLKPGSEHKRFWISEYSKIDIPLPPLPEQQKIAEILETVDNAIEKTDKIIEKYKRIKQGLMQKLLTKGIDEEGNIRSEKTHKFKDSPVGRIPVEWEVKRLGEVFIIRAGGDISKLRFSKFPDKEFRFPIYSNTIENKGLYGYANTYTYPENSITVTGRGTLGFAVPRFEKFNAIIRVLVLIPKCPVNIVYVSEYINSMINFEVEMTGVPQLTAPKISKYLIPLPPLPEQQRIAEILSQVDKVIEKEQNYKEKLKRLKQGLMEDLLIGKVRVNNLIEVVL